MRFFKQLFKRKEQLFSDIFGYEDIKWTLQKAIENEDPVHILLVGPPGLGKTRFLGYCFVNKYGYQIKEIGYFVTL